MLHFSALTQQPTTIVSHTHASQRSQRPCIVIHFDGPTPVDDPSPPRSIIRASPDPYGIPTRVVGLPRLLPGGFATSTLEGSLNMAGKKPSGLQNGGHKELHPHVGVVHACHVMLLHQ